MNYKKDILDAQRLHFKEEVSGRKRSSHTVYDIYGLRKKVAKSVL
jgi:hypothetical protein